MMTATGIFSFIIASWFILFRRANLINLMVFFLPFSAVSVVDFAHYGKSISVSLFFSMIYFIYSTLKLEVGRILSIKSSWLGGSVLITTLLSYVGYSDSLQEGDSLYVNASFHMQFFYLVLGVGIAVFIAIDVSKSGRHQSILKSLNYSMIFSSAIGLYQFVAHYLSLPYPDYIFNNSINEYAQGYTAVIGDNIKRITSVSSEPSIFSQFLIVSFSIILFTHIFGKHKKRLNYVYISLSLSFLALVLSTSSTAYLGLFTLVMIYSYLKLYNKFNVLGVFIFFIFLMSVLVGISLFLSELIMLKINSYSFYERLGSLLFGWEKFIASPIFGNGFGVITVHNIVLGVLANAGLLGFVALFAWFSFEIYRSLKLSKQKKILGYEQAVFVSFLLLMVLQIATGFAYVYTFFWVFFGILIGENVTAFKYRKSGVLN